MSFIETVDLWQRREKRDILKNINIRIERGEVFAMIGPTGAGKTTLLRLIDLLDNPASGKVFVDGIDTTSSERTRLEIRRRMAFVFQKPVVFNLSVFDNVAYGLKWHGRDKNQVHEKVNNILEITGLNGYGHRNARTLSGGEVQRVAIARAIATDPEILILDEPTANLDPVSSTKVEGLISNIIKKNAITVIMATHDMAQGQRLADNIAVLVDGEIVQSGKSNEVFSSPKNHQIAEFVGMENILEGTVTACEADLAMIDVKGLTIQTIADCEVGQKVTLCFRPEDIIIALEKLSSSARNSLPGTIDWITSHGPFCRVGIDCGFPLVSLITSRTAGEMGLERGTKVFAAIKSVSIHVIKQN